MTRPRKTDRDAQMAAAVTFGVSLVQRGFRDAADPLVIAARAAVEQVDALELRRALKEASVAISKAANWRTRAHEPSYTELERRRYGRDLLRVNKRAAHGGELTSAAGAGEAAEAVARSAEQRRATAERLRRLADQYEQMPPEQAAELEEMRRLSSPAADPPAQPRAAEIPAATDPSRAPYQFERDVQEYVESEAAQRAAAIAGQSNAVDGPVHGGKARREPAAEWPKQLGDDHQVPQLAQEHRGHGAAGADDSARAAPHNDSRAITSVTPPYSAAMAAARVLQRPPRAEQSRPAVTAPVAPARPQLSTSREMTSPVSRSRRR